MSQDELITKLREGRAWVGGVSLSRRGISTDQANRRRLLDAISEAVDALSAGLPSVGEAPAQPVESPSPSASTETLRQQLEQAERDRDRKDEQADDYERELDRVQSELTGLRQSLDQIVGYVSTLRSDAADAKQCGYVEASFAYESAATGLSEILSSIPDNTEKAKS